MKLIKIDGYWIIVSDEEIKTGDKVIDKNEPEYIFDVIEQISKKGIDGAIKDYYLFQPYFKGNKESICYTSEFENPIKCIASQNPEHNLPSITFSDEVAKELGIVDVEKRGICSFNRDV